MKKKREVEDKPPPPPKKKTEPEEPIFLAKYQYKATAPDELSFDKGAKIILIEKEDEEGWWKGKVGEQVGLFPSNYVKQVKV